jgi:hypothetical protein
MATIRREHSENRKICKLCNEPIVRDNTCYAFRDIYISPHNRDMFFHESCMMIELREAGVIEDTEAKS